MEVERGERNAVYLLTWPVLSELEMQLFSGVCSGEPVLAGWNLLSSSCLRVSARLASPGSLPVKIYVLYVLHHKAEIEGHYFKQLCHYSRLLDALGFYLCFNNACEGFHLLPEDCCETPLNKPPLLCVLEPDVLWISYAFGRLSCRT